jgi:hypothetical protein
MVGQRWIGIVGMIEAFLYSQPNQDLQQKLFLVPIGLLEGTDYIEL